jgi:putative PIN family toxin of toxin-antitoxin system
MSRLPWRVVLDTNLVLSALVFQQGRLVSLRSLWQSKLVIPLVSQATAAELIRALAYPKFRLTSAEQEELLADYLPYCSAVTLPVPPPPTPDCRDPADKPFLQLALAGEADCLVTGDKDLLVLAESFTCRILSADTFLAQVTAPG